MNDLTAKLKSLNACAEAVKWASQFSTLEEAWQNCERGDWMLWLYARSKNYEKRKDILARGYCAQLAVPYMKDSRSIDAVYAAINYGNGHINDAQLSAAAYAAVYAADSAYAAKAAYAAFTATNAAYAANAAVYAAAYAANAAYAAVYADNAAYAQSKTLKDCADICRKHLPVPII